MENAITPISFSLVPFQDFKHGVAGINLTGFASLGRVFDSRLSLDPHHNFADRNNAAIEVDIFPL